MNSARPLFLLTLLAAVALGMFASRAAPRTAAANGTWSGAYWNNTTLTGTPALQRDDGATLNFLWTGSPGPGVNADNWSAQWLRTDTYTAGTYRFTATVDDGVRVYVDGTKILESWINQPATTYTADYEITAGSHTVKVEYYDNCCDGQMTLTIQDVTGAANTWSAQYYANMTLSGTPVLTRNDADINFNWGQGSPGGAVPVDGFSARWTQALAFQDGVYQFSTTSDDGSRVYVDGALVLDYWVDQAATTHTVNATMTAGPHTVVVEYYENQGDAVMQFSATYRPDFGGFVTDAVVSGLNIPAAFAFAPDGRIFIGEKDGTILVYKNGQVLPTPFYTVSPVNDYHDRGLLGLALDPNFATNGNVYISYTYDNNPSNISGPKVGQVIRVTANGDVANTASNVVLLGTVTGTAAKPSCEDWALTADCIPSDNDSHSMGAIKFGADGMLYVATGDGASYASVDVRALRAEDIDRLAGKILRVNPTNGQGLADNPFYNGDLAATRSKVWAYGVRNDFRFNLKPGTNVIYSGDVGWDTWEEVNVITAGDNLGWPCYEGQNQQSGYAAYATCQSLYGAGGVTFGLYTYDHQPPSAAAIGGSFTGANGYPSQFQDSYWFGDYARNEISVAKVDASDNLIPGSVNVFSNAADGPVQIETGPDGDIYYLSINTGQLRHIRYVGGNRPPVAVASATPASGPAPLTVNFSSAGSNDPDAGQTTTYDWDFGDGTAHSTAADPQHTYTAAGDYSAKLTVTDPYLLTGTATVAIQAGNTAPAATLTSPVDGSTYDIGDTITMIGSGTDQQDGNLPPSALAWSVVLVHCGDITYTTCHTHPHYSTTGPAGSFDIIDHGDFVYYEVYLTVTDSGGLTDTKKATVRANTVDLTFGSNRTGVQLTVDGTTQTTPFARTVPRKSAHVIYAPSPQTIASGTVQFSSWSDGGPQQHTITANAAGAYMATFVDPPTPTPTPTNTSTPTATNTFTPTPTWTATNTSTPTTTATPQPMSTPGGPTDTPTPTATNTLAPTSTSTPTPTSTSTATPTATNTATPTPTNTATATPTNTPVPLPAPKAYYAMESASWNGTAGEVADSSGNGYNGKSVNGAFTANASPAIAGNPGTCRYAGFDGVNDYLDLGAPSLSLTNQFSVMAWVRWGINPATGNSWANIVSNNSNTTQDYGQFWLQHSTGNGKFEFAVQTTAGRTYVFSTVAPVQGQWYHVAGVYDGSTIRIYVNGVATGSVAVTGNIIAFRSQFKLNIGRWAFNSQNLRAFNGNIDEVRLFTKAVNSAELTNMIGATHPC